MKPTKENIDMLKKLGFVYEKFQPPQNEYTDDIGYWILPKYNWSLRIDCVPNFKYIIDRLIKTHYSYGYNDAKGNNKRQYKNTE